MNDQQPINPFKRILRSLGPAIITASVVLGPGSILSASKIGHTYAYQMIWVLVIAVIMMIAMTALSARLGIQLEGTICDELAKRAGRPIAIATGIILFLIAACFQFSNNLGVLAAVEPFIDDGSNLSLGIIVGMNAFIIMALYGFKHLYGLIEKLMKLLVGIMMVAFAINLFQVKPDWMAALSGFIPSIPEGTFDTILPKWDAGADKVTDQMTPLVALYATTFSVAGAFYQSYLVRQKGWTRDNLKQGLIDSTLGISMLGLITMMVLITAAKVLYQNPDVTALSSVSDVAKSLEPAFGKSAMIIFSLGIFAGAFSSFLVNAMIGGSILADGFGLGGYIDQKWPKLFTVFALLVGMAVAIYTKTMGQKPVGLIIFAQSLTVLGIPMLAIAMLWLATRADMKGKNAIPAWMKILGFVGLISSVFLALRTAVKLLLPLING
ncbi:Nramp family divalent metal transporter [Gimesia aquarii]|uniref:Divalent metal cation transporter MntH n=1 Tax=Gimesia aquarii TaxID=2527964 RepID=A0A517VNP5_9PLAN|nr:Nramp family divalent metal transporter [Gimesia aquarii]QDT94644.1 Divalent metal cation transporter MntH [Gimesia aquarii]